MPKAGAFVGDRAADAADADEAELLAAQLHAEHVVERPARSTRRARTTRSPSPSRRVTARISAHVKSAHALVSTSGVLVTTMPRARQAATSMLL